MSELNWTSDGADWPNRAASKFVEAAGIRWHVQRMGAGRSLLMLHGTGAATHSWRGLLPLLAEHFDVIAPDLPGHGFTSMPSAHRMSLTGMTADIHQLLRKLDVIPDIVVGHSAGAAILAQMCLNHNIAPRVLVSLNGALLPFGGAAGHLFAPLAKLLALNPFVPRLFAWQASNTGAVERLLNGTGSKIDAHGVELYRRLVQNPRHVAAALQMMASWQLEPLQPALPQLATKLVLVAADNDRSVPPAAAGRVAAAVPGAAVERLHRLGHLAHEESPQTVADLVRKYAG